MADIEFTAAVAAALYNGQAGRSVQVSATEDGVILAKLQTELQSSGGNQGAGGATQSESSGDQEQAVN